ncbi:MAG: CusA/CzcA family heavy metal efflux RND transporter [Deltaproteobacteria bacterium]|nr:CusA/CzcA family heavy metal efflux RND transporter [Deltaproteobacteria bacterium]
MLKRLIDVCVSRRFAVVAFTLGIAIYGFGAYQDTPIEAFPDVTNYQVNVITKAAGLAPEEIEKQVTVPLERALNGTPGMISMRSESLFGLSLIFQTFDDDIDAFKARALVTERVQASTSDLPAGADVEVGPEATPLGEVYQFRVSSDRHSLHQLRSELEWTISTQLRQVPGVADVVTFGGFLPELHVEVEPGRLAAFGLTLADVSAALTKSNLNVGGGFLRQGEQEMVVRGVGAVKSAKDLQDVVLTSHDGTPVTVGDVAHVVLSNVPRRGDVGLDDNLEVVEGFALLRRGENPSLVLDGIHAKVDALNSSILPKGMKIEPFYDRSTLVEHTLGTVHHNLLFGGLLILAVVWLFLRTIRASLIVVTIIPVALLGAFIGLHAIHLPANLISMGAIDFGILVDGAVILVENVMHEARHRKPESRRDMLALVGHAALDVSRPTFYSMAIIIAALIPVFTLQRVEGRIFRPLALTYSFALLAALVLALTLVPALCAIALRPKDAASPEPRTIEYIRLAYRRALAWLVRQRVLVIGAALALLVGGGVVGRGLGAEFLPELDEGDFVIFVEMPPSISAAYGQKILADVRHRLKAFPEVLATLSEHGRPEDGTDDEGVNMSETFVRLKPEGTWPEGMTKEQLVEDMRRSLVEIPGVDFNFSQPIKDNVEEAVSGVRGQVVLKIFGNDMDAMRETLEKAKDALGKVPGIVDLDLYRDSTVPQLQIALDRAALARAGIPVEDAQDLVETALAGKVVTQVWQDDRVVPVRVELPAAERADKARIAALPVPTADGGRVPLGELARLEVGQGRASINHEANSRFLALKFNVSGRDLGSVITDAQAVVAREVKPPDGHYFVWGGEFENQARAMARLKLVIPIALLVVLVLLYSALGSARSAAAVIITAPFAMTGGVFALAIAGIPLSVSAAVGFIALLGQVSLAGLLVVSAIESRRGYDAPLVEALIEGPASRFRALVMASLLAILGLLPMALSHAVGSETQRPFAVVIIGGMVTTLTIALFVLPVVHGLVTRKVLGAPAEDGR